MTRLLGMDTSLSDAVPRTRGDDPAAREEVKLWWDRSPHTRG